MFLDHTQRRTTVGRTPLDELITRPEESYRLWCVVCDLETSGIGAPYIYDISSLIINDLKAAETVVCNWQMSLNKMVFIACFISCISMTATGVIYLERQKVTCSCLS
jgi:hypothetical protein